MKTRCIFFGVVCAGSFLLMLLGAVRALAHCDTLDGPVVADARAALEKTEITPVLKWVGEKSEPEIREAFKKTLAVRALGGEARDLADRYFFETLVRVHRAGEGAPFTGLKPAGEVEPAIAAADRALAEGEADKLIAEVTREIAGVLRERFEKAHAAREHKDASVAAGRQFVAAYVAFIHTVEAFHVLASGAAAPHGETAAEPEAHEGAAPAATGAHAHEK